MFEALQQDSASYTKQNQRCHDTEDAAFLFGCSEEHSLFRLAGIFLNLYRSIYCDYEPISSSKALTFIRLVV